jgi:hypothetical protein
LWYGNIVYVLIFVVDYLLWTSYMVISSKSTVQNKYFQPSVKADFEVNHRNYQPSFGMKLKVRKIAIKQPPVLYKTCPCEITDKTKFSSTSTTHYLWTGQYSELTRSMIQLEIAWYKKTQKTRESMYYKVEPCLRFENESNRTMITTTHIRYSVRVMHIFREWFWHEKVIQSPPCKTTNTSNVKPWMLGKFGHTST